MASGLLSSSGFILVYFVMQLLRLQDRPLTGAKGNSTVASWHSQTCSLTGLRLQMSSAASVQSPRTDSELVMQGGC
jgi:hypothetical protein